MKEKVVAVGLYERTILPVMEKRLLKLADEIKDIHIQINKDAQINPEAINFGLALVQARWAILGILADKERLVRRGDL